MQKERIPFSDTRSFSRLLIDYLNHSPGLRPYVSVFPTVENIASVTAAVNKQKINRDVLSDSLLQQYEQAGLLNDKRKDLIESIRSEHTYTVTTGHQLQLGGGPLFFTFKILSTIRLAEALNKTGDKKFIPVFWMATEDHDVNEIDHLTLFDQEIKWNQQLSGTPITGALKLNGLDEFIMEISTLLKGKPHQEEIVELLQEVYHTSGENLSIATRKFVHAVFKNFDLLVIDANQTALKARFVPVLKKEITESFSKKLVDTTTESMTRDGYAAQAFPRECNLFYIKENNRERIEVNGMVYRTTNGSKEWDRESILEEIERYPERFSPNVILRPLFQQSILPNVATVGGPAEISYWMQTWEVFKEMNVSFPALVMRNAAMFVDQKLRTKFEKNGFVITDVFKPVAELEKEFVLKRGGNIDLADEELNIVSLYQLIIQKAEHIDPTLKATAEAELKRTLNGLENIRSKMIRASKAKHEQVMAVIHKTKETLTPGDGLQERQETILPYLAEHGLRFLDELYENLEPVPEKFLIITV